MAGVQPGLLVVTVGICLSTLATTLAGAADTNNAQAAAAAAAAPTNHDNGEPISLVRRSYVPRFVGKRESDSAENENSKADLNEIQYDLKSFVDYLKSIKYDDIDSSSKELTEESAGVLGEFADSEDVENLTDDELVSQEEKRYQPTFVGKRGRYNPMFVGKRYNPMFVGKRYNPMFVGKRYNPTFVGKRYNPMFVGKKYNPMFVGKRYNPMFVGKRYQPTFVGKRYQPTFVGKRYQPTFVGKRYIPQFVGKRYQPTFVGKRDFSGDSELESVEKRSVSSTLEESVAGPTVLNRRKRSVQDEGEEYRRAWGTYTPWHQTDLFDRQVKSTGPYRRFVAPEFIGRRDSLSSILSALDALAYTRNPNRSASKRFEAPMFIGKRPYTPTFVGKRAMRPMFVGKRDLYTPDMYSNIYPDTQWSTDSYIGSATPDLALYTEQLKH